MPYRNSLDCEGGAAPLIDRMLGTAYGVVRSVAEKLPVITYLQENIDRLVADTQQSRDTAAAAAVTSTAEAAAALVSETNSAASAGQSAASAVVSNDHATQSGLSAGQSAGSATASAASAADSLASQNAAAASQAAAHASELNAAGSADASAASAANSAAAFTTIANGTAADAGVITGAEHLTISRGAGLLGTTLQKLANWVLTLICPSVATFSAIPASPSGFYLVLADESKNGQSTIYFFTATHRYWIAMVKDA